LIKKKRTFFVLKIILMQLLNGNWL